MNETSSYGQAQVSHGEDVTQTNKQSCRDPAVMSVNRWTWAQSPRVPADSWRPAAVGQVAPELVVVVALKVAPTTSMCLLPLCSLTHHLAIKASRLINNCKRFDATGKYKALSSFLVPLKCNQWLCSRILSRAITFTLSIGREANPRLLSWRIWPRPNSALLCASANERPSKAPPWQTEVQAGLDTHSSPS